MFFIKYALNKNPDLCEIPFSSLGSEIKSACLVQTLFNFCVLQSKLTLEPDKKYQILIFLLFRVYVYYFLCLYAFLLDIKCLLNL